ncbi:uncharacterized protein LOC119458494 isoform X4 [Dermacentor silvarum]|uniref:uncharacterized protein LOC119458494 isoform X4 n=1 Tax=Dermacentor silvarum TaxID=543639 RepID=UPI002100E722|nr:uncharacterized protein LOC119458494 isoform X4 [Dermacentor silvarum]
MSTSDGNNGSPPFAGKDGSPWQPTRHTRICSCHFVNGEKSNDPRSPAYLPTLFPSVYRSTNVATAHRYERLRSREQHGQATWSCVLPVPDDQEWGGATAVHTSVGTQTDPCTWSSEVDMPSLFFCCLKECEAETQVVLPCKKESKDASWGTSYDVKDAACDPMNVDHTTSSPGFCGYASVSSCPSEKASDILKCIAGVSLSVFTKLLCLVVQALNVQGNEDTTSASNKLLLFLMKLKLNLSYSSLAVFFGLHRTTCSRHFLLILSTLHAKMRPVIYWPSRSTTQLMMPNCFKPDYVNCRVIIDCTEVPCAAPSTVHEKVLMYSSYKGTYTVKFLVGITPSGIISYISRPYGGRATDSFITSDCGILHMLEPGDLVLADKGFPQIRSALVERGVQFQMPIFARPNEPFTREEVFSTYKIASARMHVERCIQRMKLFRILSERLSADLLPHIGKIVDMCAVLANLQAPIIKDKD